MALPEKRFPDAQAAQWQSRTRGKHFPVAHTLVLGSLEEDYSCAGARQGNGGRRATRAPADDGYVEQGMDVTSDRVRSLVRFRRIARCLSL
jgi:hypothetical protein